MKRLVLMVLCVLVVSSGLWARDWRVGVLVWSMNIPGQVAMRQGLEQAAREIDAALQKGGKDRLRLEIRVAGDGNAGIEKQILQFRELLAMKVDAIIVQPTDNAALAAPLQEANKRGIPVVAYDQYISGGTLASYLTSDNYMAGWLDGEYLAAWFPDTKEIRLVLVEYPHVSSTVERVDGLLDALSKAGQPYRIVARYEAVEPIGGRMAGERLLKDFPAKGSVDAVFTVNDGGGLSVVDALARAGRTEVVAATIDGDPASVENIRKGRITIIDSAQFCGPLGAESMNTCWAVLQGKKVVPHQLIPVFPVTRETLSRYPGWMGPIPGAFTKPWKSTEPQWSGTLRAGR